MVRLVLFTLLLLGACGFALWKGTRDARVVAATCLIAAFASVPLFGNYERPEIPLLLIDLLVLGVFVHVALHSDRFWPMWIAGLQITASFGHVLKFMSSDLVPIAYAVALRFWSYPELIILAIAVWRGDQRRRHPPPALLPSG